MPKPAPVTVVLYAARESRGDVAVAAAVFKPLPGSYTRTRSAGPTFCGRGRLRRAEVHGARPLLIGSRHTPGVAGVDYCGALDRLLEVLGQEKRWLQDRLAEIGRAEYNVARLRAGDAPVPEPENGD